MKRIHKQTIELPFEEGQTYKTKFATGTFFTITKIDKNKNGDVVQFWGIHEDAPHLGICPLAVDRLITRTELTGVEFEVLVCPHCKKDYK